MKTTIKKVLLLSLVLIMLLPGTAFAAKKKQTGNQIKKAQKLVLTDGKWQGEGEQRAYQLADGSLVKNRWANIEGKIYLFSKKGYVRCGWFTYRKKEYYANQQGEVIYNQLQNIGKKTYYLAEDGSRVREAWVKVKKKHYWFNKNGVMQKNKLLTVGSGTYYVDKYGARVTNKWIKIKTIRYYFGKKGELTKKKYLKGSPTYLFVGDSRTVGMSMSVGAANTHFIGKVNMGYNWLMSTASGQVRSFINSHKNVYVIYCFGVNDLGNIHQYIAHYRSMRAAYPKVTFRFLSVNPVVDGSSRYVSNAGIRAFNARLKAAFPAEYVDTYAYVQGNMQTFDGVHYTTGTYRLLYNYIMGRIL